MTVHAGQKAARLRRATNSSSNGIASSVSTSFSSSSLAPQSSKAPLDISSHRSLTKDLLDPSPLHNTANGDHDLLEKQNTPTQATPTLAKKSRNRYGTKRKGGRQVASSNSTCTSSQNFVFSGFDPTPIGEIEMKNIDWQQRGEDVDVSVSTTVSDIVSPPPPPLIFVAQPSSKSKPKSNSKPNGPSKDKESTTSTSSPRASTSKQQQESEKKTCTSKASPGRYTSWFSFTKGDSSNDQEAHKADLVIEDKGKGGEAIAEDALKSKATKKKRKKPKAKVKAIDDTLPTSEEKEKKVASSPNSKKAQKSKEAAGTSIDTRPMSRSCENHTVNGTIGEVSGSASTESEAECTTIDENLLCPNEATVSQDPVPSQESIPDKTSARACKEDSNSLHNNQVKCRKLTLEALSSIRPISSVTHERRGSTETTYHTAAPTTPSWDSDCNPSKLLDISSSPSSRTTTPLYSTAFPVGTTPHFECNTFSSNNSLVSMTEDSAITTEETQASTHSSPKMDLFDDHMMEDNDGSPDKTLTVIGRSELRHYSSALSISQCSREVSLHPLQLEIDSSSGEIGKGKESGMAQLERLQRTLHWRLMSANRDASVVERPLRDNVCCRFPPGKDIQNRAFISHIPSAMRLEEPSKATFHQESRRASFAWIHLLPSLEEIHPRRSIEREMNLRSLAWLGLEEYVARRSKGLGNSDDGASVVWITHTSFPRSSVLHRTKAAHIEPLLCSSAFWLRSANKNTIGNRDTSMQGVMNSIKAYQAYLQIRDVPKVLVTSSLGARLDSKMPALGSAQKECLEEVEAIKEPMLLRPGELSVPNIVCPSSAPMLQSTSQDLQKYIELSMFELRCSHDSKKASGEEWLQAFSSIEAEEKSAILAFLGNSHDEVWQGVESDILPQQSPLYGSSCAEVAWPTTPYTPVNLLSGLPDQSNVVEKAEQPGLSAGEMEEIEDAMYRDYLSQANQYPKSVRKKEKYGDSRFQGRSQAYSSSRIIHGSPVSSSAGRANTIDDINRYMSGPSPSTTFTGSSTSVRRDNGHISRGDGTSKDSRSSSVLSRQSSTDCGKFSDATQRCIQESTSTDLSLTMNPLQNHGLDHLMIKEQHTSDKDKQIDWNRENSNLAVQSSLANLQQHLALVSSQKQNNSHPNWSSRVSPLLTNHSLHMGVASASDTVSTPTASLYRSLKEHTRRPAPCHGASILPTVGSPNRHTQQSLLQNELQRQQFQLSIEASREATKLLEERHLLSRAQALGEIKQQANSLSSQSQPQSTDGLDRIQIAIAECARLGRISSTKQTPLITLTEPSLQERRLKGTLKMNTRMNELPWSDDPFQSRDQLYSPRTINGHQTQVDHLESDLHTINKLASTSETNFSRRYSLQPLDSPNHVGSPLQLSPTNASIHAYFPSLDLQRSPQKMERKANYSSVVKQQKGKSRINSPWQKDTFPSQTPSIVSQQQSSQSDWGNLGLLDRSSQGRASISTSSPMVNSTSLR